MKELAFVDLYLKVVELRGLAAASRALGLPRSSVSRKVSELERLVGARLLQRTPRSFGLTEAGSLVHRQFRKIADARAELDEALDPSAPRGLLRVTAPCSFAQVMVAPLLRDFLATYPAISISMDLNTRRVDLVADEFDVALRMGKIDSVALIGRRLGASRFVLCASPTYLAGAPPLREPADLAQHAAVVFSPTEECPRTMTFVDGDHREVVDIHSRLTATDLGVVLQAALGGTGVACLPERLARDHLRSGALVRCLEGWGHGEAAAYALYPSRRALTPKVRVFIDYLVANLDFSVA